jgi:hypothetical protein
MDQMCVYLLIYDIRCIFEYFYFTLGGRDNTILIYILSELTPGKFFVYVIGGIHTHILACI